MKKFAKKLSFRYFFPCTILMVLQIIIIILTIYYGATFKEINTKAVENFNGKVELGGSYIQSQMVDSWGNLGNDYDRIRMKIEKSIIYQSDSFQNVEPKGTLNSLCISALEQVEEDMYMLLRKNKVTEAYVILNTGENTDGVGIYLRDLDPNTNAVNDIDVIVESSPTIIRDAYMNKGYNLSTKWETSFPGFTDISAFSKTIETAKKYSSSSYKHLGYWSDDVTYHDSSIITYSLPLIINENVCGVIGIGIDKTNLKTQLLRITSSAENLDNIALARNTQLGASLVVDGFQDKNLSYQRDWVREDTDYEDVYTMMVDESKYYISTHKLSIYSSNSPYEIEEWLFSGVILEDDLFQGNSGVLSQIVYAAILALGLTLVSLMVIGTYLSSPIRRLISNLSNDGIKDYKTNIFEIDLLLSEIEKYEKKVYEYPKKMNQIIEMAGLKVASFEISMEENYVVLGQNFYNLLCLEDGKNEITINDFQFYVSKVCKTKNIFSLNENVFFLEENNTWIRFKVVPALTGFIGVIFDVTKEMEDKIKIETERDHDFLTGLLNRGGFFNKADKFFQNGMKEALMMMIDLDNLKKLNDTFGHDAGDEYIKTFARILHEISSEKIICCHLSGDEFLVLLHNYESKEAINEEIERIKSKIENTEFVYYDVRKKISISCGMVYYSYHQSVEELRKEADFAMYEIKASSKGGFNFFNSDRYTNNSIEYSLKEKFVNMINSELVTYHFQPIVSLKTAEVLGYEALMRPLVEEFKSPLKVIEYAKKLKMLNQIEEITLFKSLECFSKFDCDKLIFINSIANQIICPKKNEILFEKYNEFLSRIVVEITEEEDLDVDVMNQKLEYVKNNNSMFAIDDYGTGYNTILSIFKYKPAFVKISGEFITGINKDLKKRELVKPLVKYCHSNGISVIAECVESKEELEIIMNLKFDYVQGYLIGMPIAEVKDISQEKKDIIFQMRKKLKIVD